MNEIIQMNFSGVCGRQNFFEKMKRIDLTDIQGTNGYCSDEAAAAIRERVGCFPAKGMHLLDSGNYHYASLFWLEKIREPFELLVFDHHTDMQPSAWGDDLLSCGSWVRTALLRDQTPDGPGYLRHVWLAGPPEKSFLELEEQADWPVLADRVGLLSGLDTEEALPKEKGLPVYISIDKDILSKEELDTNWDQGDWSLEQLVSAVEKVCSEKRVIGIDICGEPDIQAHDAEMKKSQAVNQALLALVRYLNI